MKSLPVSSIPVSGSLLLSRLIAGGALVLAAALKLRGGALPLSLSIDSFKLLPGALHLPVAYYLPWFELTIGLALVLGFWTRQSAALATGLYGLFTMALASVLVRGMDIDCGCFGDLFGNSSVSWLTVLRNLVFIAAALVPALLGGGLFAVSHDEEDDERRPSSTEAPRAGDAAAGDA